MSRISYFNKLVILFTARLAVPDNGSMMDGFKFLSSKESISNGVQKATEQAKLAIEAVKASRDNPYGDDTEAIAKAIIEKVEKIKAEKRGY